MVGKKISVVVEAIVKGAREKLKGVTDELQRLGRQGGRTAKEMAGPLDDLRRQFDDVADRTGRLKDRYAELEPEITRTGRSFDVMGFAAQSATEAVALLGAAFAAAKLGQRAIEIAEAAAMTMRLAEGFSELSARSQVDSDRLLAALKKASRGTISEYQLMLEANKAWYLGIAQNTEQYIDLMKIADVKAKDLGVSTEQYWQRLTNAVASGYPQQLKMLGITIDLDQAYTDYATTLNKTVEELDDQEKTQARLNAILAEGEPTLRRWEEAGADATDTFARFHAVTANLRQEIAEKLIPVLLPALEWMNTALVAAEDPLARQNEVIAALVEETGSLAQAEIEFAKSLEWSSAGLIDGANAARIASIAMLDYRLSLIGIDEGIREDIEAMRMAEKATIDWSETSKISMDEIVDAYDGLWSRFDYLYDQYQEAGEAAKKSSKTQVDAWGRVEDAIWRIGQRAAAQRAALDRREAQDRARLERRLADQMADIQIDAARDRLDAHTDYYRDLRDLDSDYAFDRQEAERRLAFDVFEAAGRRDAIGIRRMQRQARYERGRAKREHGYERSQLGRHFGDKLNDLQTALEREQEDRRRAYDIQLRELEIRMEEQREEARIQEELRTQEAIDEWNRRNEEEKQTADEHLNREMLPLYGTYYEDLMGYDQAWRDQVQQPVVFPTPPPVPTPGPGPPPGPGPTDCPDGYFWDGTHCVRAPVFQTGGIVPGTFGQPVPIMAHAGEFIMPSRMSQRLGAESLSTLNINISGSLDVTGEPMMAEQIEAQITEGLMIAINRVTGQRV